MAKFFFCTFGCRCNQADSAALRDRLVSASLREAGSHRDADLIVVNTCTVTRRADQQVRQAVRRLRRDNPNARMVVTGCYAERDPVTLASIPGVDLVLGNADRPRLAEVWRQEPGATILHSPLAETQDHLTGGSGAVAARTRPFVKVQDGCDARCAYCIVPSVRGRGYSAGPDEILAEIRRLVGQGFQEIVLTGVHLGAYGRRLAGRPTLADLLRRILEIPGLGRLRLSSMEPMGFDAKILELAAQYRSLARHFHIPLQSGSDRILRRMHRPYSAARYLELVSAIRERLPEAGLGADVLVGFPGEAEEDFAATCDLVRRSPLSYLHIFPFSAREGTEAFSLPDRVPAPVLRRRCETLRRLAAERNLSFRRQFVGLRLAAITLSREEALGASVALTENYIRVKVSGSPVAPNRLVEVRIEEAGARETVGRIGPV